MSKSVSDNGSTGGSRGKSRAGRGKRNESSTIGVRGYREKWAKSSHGSSVSKNGRKTRQRSDIRDKALSNCSQVTKKRSHHSNDDSDDGWDSVTESSKKKLKRKKGINGSYNKAGTSTSQSDSEENDSDGIEEGPNENRYSLEELLRSYTLWMTVTAGGENLDCEVRKDVLEAKSEVDDRREEALGICKSQAWCADFREHVRTYPEFKKENTRDNMPRGDMRLVKKCEVCNREGHPWSVIVRLTGKPYNKETFEEKEVEDDEDEDDDEDDEDDDDEGDKDEDKEEGVQYYMGRFCHLRTELFHKLFHFPYHQRCKKKLEKVKNIDQVAGNSTLLSEMNMLAKWIQKAEKDYKKDGKRTNNKWNQEFG